MNPWLCFTVGAVLGTCSGLGIGGGSILMLWLTMAAGFSQAEARLINLLFFLPGAMLSTWLRRKEGLAPAAMLTCAAGAGLIGSGVGMFLHGILQPVLLRRGLGILFLITGLREIRYRDRELR